MNRKTKTSLDQGIKFTELKLKQPTTAGALFNISVATEKES